MMSPLIFVIGILYGIISIAIFLIFLIFTAAAYNELGDGFHGEFHGYVKPVVEIMRMLGVFRCICVGVIALLWPASIAAFSVLLIPSKKMSHPTLKPTRRQQMLLWLFLGFGKFRPTNFYRN